MRKLNGGVCMSCRLRSFQYRGVGRGDPRAASLVAISIRESLPLRPFVRGGRGRLVERGAIDREVSEEQRDMTPSGFFSLSSGTGTRLSVPRCPTPLRRSESTLRDPLFVKAPE